MENNGYPQKLVEAIKNLYKNSTIVIKVGINETDKILINKGVRQGCPVSLILFNIYIDDIIQNWKQIIYKGIKISKENIKLQRIPKNL